MNNFNPYKSKFICYHIIKFIFYPKYYTNENNNIIKSPIDNGLQFSIL